MRIQHTRNQGLFQLFLTVSWDLHAYRCTPAGFSSVSVVPEAVHKVSRRPLKDTVSAQKARQGSGTETSELLGGTTENKVSHRFPLQKSMIFSYLASLSAS